MEEPDFTYWRHPTVPGIKVEEVSGGTRYKGKVWKEMARQIYCENGRDEYREIGHYRNGAPFLFGEQARISVTHCDGLFAVATLPDTPDTDLSEFSETTAMGIDAERADRSQVLNIRERFLSPEELREIPAEDVGQNVLAWTVKEAVYKAALHEGLDFRNDIRIVRMPRLAPPTPVFDHKEFGLGPDEKNLPESFFGEAVTVISNNKDEGETTGVGNCCNKKQIKYRIYSYVTDGTVVTLAYTPSCITFGKNR